MFLRSHAFDSFLWIHNHTGGIAFACMDDDEAGLMINGDVF